LVCLSIFAEARKDLNRARRGVAEAALALTICRERLNQVIDHALQQQIFSLIEALFREEEAARKIYERAAKYLARSEKRWFALRAALASEQAQAQLGSVPRYRLN
jgi:transposase